MVDFDVSITKVEDFDVSITKVEDFNVSITKVEDFDVSGKVGGFSPGGPRSEPEVFPLADPGLSEPLTGTRGLPPGGPRPLRAIDCFQRHSPFHLPPHSLTHLPLSVLPLPTGARGLPPGGPRPLRATHIGKPLGPNSFRSHSHQPYPTQQEPEVFPLADPGLSEPPACMAVLEPVMTSLDDISASQVAVLLGTEAALLRVDGETVQRVGAPEMSTAVQRMAVSASGKLLACFTADGQLHVLLTTDLSRRISHYDTQIVLPPDAMAWCGEDAVLLSWQHPPALMLVGPGDAIKYSLGGEEDDEEEEVEGEEEDGEIEGEAGGELSRRRAFGSAALRSVPAPASALDTTTTTTTTDSCLILIPECDGVRLLSSSHSDFISRVPEPTVAAFALASTAPPALLLEAFSLFERRSGKADEHVRAMGVAVMGEAVRGCMQAAAHEGDVDGQKRLLAAAAFGRAFCRSGFYPLLPLAEPSAGCMQAAAHEGDVNGQKRLLSAAAFGRAFCRSGFYPLLPLAEPSADGVGDVLMGEAVRGCMQAAAHEGDVNGQKRLLSAAAFGRAFCRSGFYPLLPLAEPSADGVGDVLMGEAVRGCMQAAAHEGDVNGQKRLLSAAAFGRAFCRSGFYPLLPLAEPSADGVGDVLMGEAVRGCMQAAAHEGDVNGQKRLLSAAAFGRAFCRSGFYPLLPLAEPSADGVGDVLMGEAVRGCMQAAAHEGDVNGQKRLLSAAAFGRAFCRSGFYPLLPLAEPSADGVGDVLMGEAVRGCMQAAAHEGDVNGQKRLLSAAAFGRAFCRSGFYPLLPLAEPSADGVGDVLMGEAVRGCMQAAAHEGDVNGQKRLLSAAAFGRAFCRSGFYPLLPLAEPSADGVGDVLMGEAVRGCMQAAAHEGDVNGQKRLLSAAAFGRAFCRSGFYPLLPLAEPSADGVGDVLMGEAVRGCMQAAAHEGDVNGQKRLLSAAAFGRAFCRSGFYPLLPLAEPSADGVGDVLMGEAVRGCMQAAAHEGDVNGQKRLLSAAAFGRAFCRMVDLEYDQMEWGDVLMGEAVRGCMQAAAHEGDVNGQKRLLSAAAFGRAFCRSGFYPLLPLAEPSADGVGDVLMGEAVRGCMQAAAHEGDVNGQKRLLSAAAFGRAFCRMVDLEYDQMEWGDVLMGEAVRGCMQAAAHEGDVNGQKRLLSAAAFGRAFCRSGFYPLLPLAEPSAEAASIRCCLWQSLLQVSQDGRSRVRSDGVGDVLMGEAVRGCMQAAAHEGGCEWAEAASIRCCLWQSLLQVSQDGRSRVRSDGVGDVLMGEAVRGCMQAAAHEGDVNGQKRLLSAAAFGRAFCRMVDLEYDQMEWVDVLMGEAVRGCMQAAAHEGDVNGQKRLLSAAAFGRAFCRCMQAAAHEGDVNGQKRLLSAACLWQSLLQAAAHEGDVNGQKRSSIRCCLWQSLLQAAAHEGDVNGQKRLLSAAAFGRAFCRSGFYPLLPLAELLQVSQDGRSRVRSDGVGDVLMGEAVRGCMQAAAHEGDVNGQKRLLSAAAFGRAFCRGCMQAAAHEGDVNGQKRLLSAAAFGRAFCRSGFLSAAALAEPILRSGLLSRCCLWQSLLQVKPGMVDLRVRRQMESGDVLMGEAAAYGCRQLQRMRGIVNGQKRLLSAAAFGRAF
ncbi:unnamed protein product [Closterium sp. Naga37s-1]|nr:unnamed protein product [Closterium sp. Naga37s-1]